MESSSSTLQSPLIKTRFNGMIILVIFILLGYVWLLNSRLQPTAPDLDNLTEAPIPGYLAPGFVLNTTQGERMALGDVGANRPVVLNFWATWCGPCRAEMPDFQRISQKYGEQVAILGVNQREDGSDVTSFALEVGVTYPLLLDLDGAINRLYNVRALPTTLFIDQNGVIDEVYTGIMTEAVLESRIQQLLLE